MEKGHGPPQKIFDILALKSSFFVCFESCFNVAASKGAESTPRCGSEDTGARGQARAANSHPAFTYTSKADISNVKSKASLEMTGKKRNAVRTT